MGKIEALWIKTARKGGPMKEVKEMTLVANKGIMGNANQGGRRQVTLLETENWTSLMNELGVNYSPIYRRSNILISGFALKETTHRIIKIGDCLLQVTMETEPCDRMNDVCQGLFPLMSYDWKGGVCTKVIKGGLIKVGDLIEWYD